MPHLESGRGFLWSKGGGCACSDAVMVQSTEEISCLVPVFTHCLCSSQCSWLAFLLPEHPRPYSLQFGQPVAIIFKGQLSRNCSTKPRASCAFAVPVLLWFSLVCVMGQNWQQVSAELGGHTGKFRASPLNSHCVVDREVLCLSQHGVRLCRADLRVSLSPNAGGSICPSRQLCWVSAQ